ncbi:MAG: AI-2E family transporter [Terriglobia bacterium]|jgi:predicted PurR-regulated permease PerM|nr:AI-2E family transporter [Terriglobia bacterium]
MTSQNNRSDILFAFFIAILLALAWYVRDVLLLIYVSILFAVVIGPAIVLVQKLHIRNWRPGRALSVIVILAIGLFLLTVFFLFALPPIFADLQGFARDLPAKGQNLYARLHGIPVVGRINLDALEQHATEALGGALGLARGIAGGVFAFFTWLIITAYFILDGERAFLWFLSLFPASRQPRLRQTAIAAERRVSKWLLGQALLMLILGSLSLLVFWLLDVKYFYALGVFCGLANIVPIVGPVVSVGLATIVAAFDSWTKAAGVLIFYIIYQQVENAFLTPRIMKSTVDLPPLAVIIALVLGGAIAGILGALVAVPTAALIAVIIDEYVVKANAAP